MSDAVPNYGRVLVGRIKAALELIQPGAGDGYGQMTGAEGRMFVNSFLDTPIENDALIPCLERMADALEKRAAEKQ